MGSLGGGGFDWARYFLYGPKGGVIAAFMCMSVIALQPLYLLGWEPAHVTALMLPGAIGLVVIG